MSFSHCGFCVTAMSSCENVYTDLPAVTFCWLGSLQDLSVLKGKVENYLEGS